MSATDFNIKWVKKMEFNDKNYRDLLIKELNMTYENTEDTRIIHELGLDSGSSRIDVAVVNGILHGYEIKSDLDNLDRLPRQMEYYNQMFERMTIVVSRKYLTKVQEIIPSWWGIKVMSNDCSRLISIRKGRKVNQQDTLILLKLLWKKDLENFIDYLNLDKSIKKMRKKNLLQFLLQEASKEDIKTFVYSTLKSRTEWRNTANELYSPSTLYGGLQKSQLVLGEVQ